MLSRIYFQGDVVTVDLESAYTWGKIAFESGNKAAFIHWTTSGLWKYKQ